MILEYLSGKIEPLSKRLLSNKQVMKFAARFPRTYQFLINRLTIKKITGFPATLLVSVLLLNFLLLSEVVEDFVNSTEMQHFDMSITMFFYHHRIPALTEFFLAVTQLGITKVITMVSVVMLLWLLIKGQWVFFFGLAISVTGSGAAMYYSKLFFKRVRPDGLGVIHVLTYSFPSGHATAAIALYGFICFYAMCMVKPTKTRWILFISGVLLVLLIGLSRIYLGVHFFSDVIAGYSLGSIWLLMAVSLVAYKKLR